MNYESKLLVFKRSEVLIDVFKEYLKTKWVRDETITFDKYYVYAVIVRNKDLYEFN